MLIGVLFKAILDHEWWGATIIALTIAFTFSILFGIRYIIRDDRLIVKVSIYMSRKIPIQEIVEIRPTRNPISSPAASFDRYQIRYKRSKTVIISPERPEEFIADLKRINPNILA